VGISSRRFLTCLSIFPTMRLSFSQVDPSVTRHTTHILPKEIMVIRKKISGVYKITCTENSCCYIGQSGDISQRWSQHLENLMSNRHVNLNLQEAWNKHGLAKFSFTVLEIVQGEKDRTEREKHFIRDNLAICYNSQWDRAHSISNGKIIHCSSGKEMNAPSFDSTQSVTEIQEDLVSKWHRMVSKKS